MPKSQVKIGQKLKPKVKIWTLKNFGSNFFYKLTLTKRFGSNNRKKYLAIFIKLDELSWIKNLEIKTKYNCLFAKECIKLILPQY